MASKTSIDPFDRRMAIGFNFTMLGNAAGIHEGQPAFKRDVVRYLERVVGANLLSTWSKPIGTQFPYYNPDSGHVSPSDVVKWANALLGACPETINVANIDDECCMYTPPRRWDPCRQLPLYIDGAPMTAREIVIEYKKTHSMAYETELELSALPLLLSVSWSVDISETVLLEKRSARKSTGKASPIIPGTRRKPAAKSTRKRKAKPTK